MILIVPFASQTVVPALPTYENVPITSYGKLGLEATKWITSFQVTPLNDTWGIPFSDDRAWGLDPYFFDNGTITAGVGNITAGVRQRFAYLIGGHDAGEGAYAALNAYLETQDPRYLDIFNVYYNYFQFSQIPGARTVTPAITVTKVSGKNITVDDSGYWAEQASVSAGDNGTFGGGSDQTSLQAVYPAAEHGNPIAASLIAYYRATNDTSVLPMLNRYGNWLVRIQIHTGQYAGAFPVTQYYFAIGWKPRMYETTESAWILAELYMVTGNQTYLNASQAAANYMLSRQLIGPQWVGTPVYGALPYEWNETHYTNTVLTNHAGFTILAWSQLYRLTGNTRYLNAARKYANWLLSFQVTSAETEWGNHTYANDSYAVGGFYYGYDTAKREFGSGVAESLWSASYSIPALFMLSQITGNQTYRYSAVLAANWLTRMRYPDQTLIPLQALAVTKYPLSSWWGLFPQYYQPDMREITKVGIVSFVNEGAANQSLIKDRHPSWFEQTFSVDFNLIDYQMASRGPTYMKMIWSWWPDLGFEPRYGGDIAFGAYATDGYLSFNATFDNTNQILNEIENLAGSTSAWLPLNVTASRNQARELLTGATESFGSGWYALANAQAREALSHAEAALNYVELMMPITQGNELLIVGVAITLALLILSNAHWYRKSKPHKASLRRRRQRHA